ncbi:hypothetical protein, partial [Xenorhabdus entomophaga]|uniref:hypothetical protein n=1 Tax=Xenorhabdus entomophaga TaxID=3136257 RepID=UPI0030F39504
PQRYLFVSPDYPTVSVSDGAHDTCAFGPPKATNDTQKIPTMRDIGTSPETTTQTSFSQEYDKETFPDFGFDQLTGKYWKVDSSNSDIVIKGYYAYDYQNRVYLDGNGNNALPVSTPVTLMCQISSVY